MTDNRNTILAVILSGLVLLGWQYFFNIPQMEKQRAAQLAQSQTTKPAPDAANTAARRPAPRPRHRPTHRRPISRAPLRPVSRDTAIAATPRVKIETPRLTGSISLKGARIDDLSLVQFRDTVDPASPAIVLYSPSGTESPYYAEFGWVAASGSTVQDSRPEYDLAAGEQRQPDAVEPGDAEIRQWRRSYLPPHDCDRRSLSVHHQG